MQLSNVLHPSAAGRPSNRQRALAVLHSKRPIGRAELAKRLGVSVQAASNITSDLLAAELIQETGRREGQRGLPVALYDLHPDGAFALGFEIRPTALYATVKDQTGVDRAQHRIALDKTDPDHVIGMIARQTRALFDTLPLDQRVISAAIVRPGPFGDTGFPSSQNELPGWDLPDLKTRLEQAVGVPVMLENDATAGACAEHLIGCAQGISDFAYLYFGSGLGLGIVSDGFAVRGAFGNAGEIGHLRLPRSGEILEDHLSRTALERHLAKQGTKLRSIADIETLMKNGSAHLDHWLQQGAEALAYAVEIIENLLDPATIVLGGAMPQTLLNALIEHCDPPTNTVSFKAAPTLPRLQVGTCGPFTVSGGAASMVLNSFFHHTAQRAS